MTNYLARLKAIVSEKGIPHELPKLPKAPAEPPKCSFGSFGSDGSGRVLKFDAEARASVDELCADMAAENERRREWWTKPVEGWREGRLIIRSVMTGKTNVIYLRSKGARK
jgi:hypothetical protein